MCCRGRSALIYYSNARTTKLKQKLCLHFAGKPTPYVHWYRDNELIDDTYNFGTTNNTVHNDLLINKLSRSMFNTVLSCTASNNLTKAITVRVSLDINCEQKSVILSLLKPIIKKSYDFLICYNKYLVKPIDVEIVNARHTLTVGREVELSCESRGSRPPAQLTWYKDNQELSNSRYSIDCFKRLRIQRIEILFKRGLNIENIFLKDLSLTLELNITKNN